MPISKAAKERFETSVSKLLKDDEKLGLAVSGGPDSLALLALAHAVMPDRIAVATVDHGLRAEAKDEAAMVVELCEKRGIACEVLTAKWAKPPKTNVQARARHQRYALLADWARREKLPAIATAHHADDQVETLLMRLLRGAGVSGLSGIKRVRRLSPSLRIVRPLLDFPREDLLQVVKAARMTPVEDPSNEDDHHDRVRLRKALSQADLGDPMRIAATARYLAEADRALDWMTNGLADIRLTGEGDALLLDPEGLPREIMRRLMRMGIARLGDRPPRGPELNRLIVGLTQGRTATLGTLKFSPAGKQWRIEKAPARKG
ncbi:tRNA lysidine(34) synthetase TilS [Sphingomicrobium nitratireducens]|uniref:tRNA lysidine(34) synthetase TilS n=1 Tax=Sphingomicrobium nitratireducens TaxID=2964666 RepID=UPI00223F6D81